MDFVCSGVITQVLPVQQGTSQKSGNPWVCQEYVICHEQGQYPRSLCFRVFGQERINQMNIQPGEQLTVHLNITCQPSRSGGYFNSVECWRVERQPQPQPQPQPAPLPAPQQGYQQPAPVQYPPQVPQQQSSFPQQGLPFPA